MRLEHVNMTVKDVEKSFQFYQKIFGFEKRWKGKIDGDTRKLQAMHIGNKDTYIALFEAETFEAETFEAEHEGGGRSDYRTPGINHVAFEVEDLDLYRNKLKQAGVEIHLEADYEPGKRLYFSDLDGVEVELVAY